uniref:Beta-galactosidase beta-sandwich domain-containing protein n=1 Tax=Cucumis melo TaxID=3656 RepID=A0A9I9DHU5_CUCME
MCQQSDAPQPIINTSIDSIAITLLQKILRVQKCSLKIGWDKKWGDKDPYRTAKDVVFFVARFFNLVASSTIITCIMEVPTLEEHREVHHHYILRLQRSLDEDENLNQPKWGHLKQLHASIKLGEKILTNGMCSYQNFGSFVTLTKFFNSTTEERFFFLSNTDGKNDATIDLQANGKYFVPAWSVSILDGCNKEVYNTLKVNPQTSIFVKKQTEKENAQLSWTWAP